jgi:DeoR family fructose operon transcriptional repressor
MLKEERFTKILQYVNEMKYASLEDLMTLTSSSESTIRADLVELARNKKIVRLRGGAQALDIHSSSYEMSVSTKEKLEAASKRKIGEYAATLIEPKSLIYIDAGTSTNALAKEIHTKDITIVTNSNAIGEHLTKEGFDVYVTGGKIKLTTDAYTGSYTLDFISRFKFDAGFFGVNAINEKEGLTTPDFEEAQVKKQAMSRCTKVYVLADHTKFNSSSAVTFSTLDNLTIITDKHPSEGYKQVDIKEAR